MMNLFLEGGWGMVPVLVFGLVLVYAAARYAWDMAQPRLRFVAAMCLLLSAAIGHAMLTNIAAVFAYVRDPALVPDADLARIVFTGLMESTRPGALGGAFVVVALVLVAVGAYRDSARELRITA